MKNIARIGGSKDWNRDRYESFHCKRKLSYYKKKYFKIWCL